MARTAGFARIAARYVVVVAAYLVAYVAADEVSSQFAVRTGVSSTCRPVCN